MSKPKDVPITHRIIDTQRGIGTGFIAGPLYPTFLVHPYGDVISDELARTGNWETKIIDAAKKFLKSNSNCIDVGANLGVWSYYLSKHCNQGKVLAFEPQTGTYNLLCANMYINSVSNLESYRLGLTDHKNHQEYLPLVNLERAQNNGASAIITRQILEKIPWYDNTLQDKLKTVDYNIDLSIPILRDHQYEVELIELVAFDRFVQEKKHLQDLKIDFIKIDVEGHEIKTLKGMIKTINKHRPIIFIEIWEQNVDVVKKWFSKHDYELHNFDAADYIAIHKTDDRKRLL